MPIPTHSVREGRSRKKTKVSTMAAINSTCPTDLTSAGAAMTYPMNQPAEPSADSSPVKAMGVRRRNTRVNSEASRTAITPITTMHWMTSSATSVVMPATAGETGWATRTPSAIRISPASRRVSDVPASSAPPDRPSHAERRSQTDPTSPGSRARVSTTTPMTETSTAAHCRPLRYWAKKGVEPTSATRTTSVLT